MTDEELKGLFETLRSGTRQDLVELRQEMQQEFASLRDETRQEFADVHARFAGMDNEFAGVHARFAGMDNEFANVNAKLTGIDNEFANVNTKLAGIEIEFANVHARFESIDKEFTNVRKEMAAEHDTTRRHIDVLLEQVDKRFDAVNESGRNLEAKLESVRVELETRIDVSTRETQEMIRFSHAGLDRRVQSLEQNAR